ncbi:MULTISPECIES: hypothetical protein [unclassified Leptolyngbya]|uniref:hypothetical protein n=1 Tax=unclassified Leptolyngbya TaxID=2650499 RepID=UPI001688A8AF|nr:MULTISPECIES: hypothetical protein [unclassified Leptolyngbya]MBD1909185.1 hypothetical protein [Leptolyngbya sp. FACHB-8]MBD2158434.1 hypothetical protein [Leptolyngbya sp. FACHB-16]
MPPQKARSFQTPETLPKLQRLIQLSNVPLVRIAAVALVRYQLWIMGSLFTGTLIFNILHPAPWLTVNRIAAIEFLSAVSQSLAALLGVLIVFLTVSSQLISQRRLDEYRALQTQIEQLIHLTQTLPSELNAFDEMLMEVINYLVPLQMQDFPIESSLAKDEKTVILENLLTEFRQVWAEKQKQLPLAARLHLQQILLVLNNTNEILEEFLMLYHRILEVGRFILAIVRLSFLLGVSLLFLLLFGIIELQNSFPDLSLPIMVTLTVWVLIALLELVGNTWFVYKNFHGPWSRSIYHRHYQSRLGSPRRKKSIEKLGEQTG